MIPRVFHWWWDGPPVPPEYVDFRNRWMTLHPEWRLEVWSEARWLTEFREHPVARLYLGREHYSRYAHPWGWKTNIARYAILQRYGGVWVDADLEPLKPIDPLICDLEASKANVLAAYEDRTHLNNAFLASTAGGSWISALMDGLENRIKVTHGKPSNVMTGPHYLTSLVTRPDILTIDRALIYPMHWSELDRRGEAYPTAYTVHHWHRKTQETQRAMTTPPTAAAATPGRKPPVTRRRRRYGVVQRSGPSQKAAAKRSAPTQGATAGVLPRTIRDLPGLTPDNVMIALADMAVRVPHDQAIVELGTYQGKTAITMAWGAARGGNAHVFAVDPWDLPGERFPWSELQDSTKPHRPAFTDPRTREAAEWHVKALGFAGRVTLIRAFGQDAGHGWTGHPVGLLFIDSDHRYEAVRGDLAAWSPHLVKDAVIAFDDHAPTHPEVIRAVGDMVNEGILTEVKIFHDRLAVTSLTSDALKILANQETEPPHDPPLSTSGPELSTTPEVTELVREGELEDVPSGTSVDQLTIVQLRALAKIRGITLGRRKDKRALMLTAIREGR